MMSVESTPSHDVLFEIGTEELPSGAVLPLAEALQSNLAQGLAKARLDYKAIQCFATPRRLAIRIQGLLAAQPAQNQRVRGPALSHAYDAERKPTKALLGFARSLAQPLEALSVDTTEKGAWIVYDAKTEGMSTRALLPSILEQAVEALPKPKPMRWGIGAHVFVRPVHWILLLVDEELLPFSLFGIKADGVTYGHRFHAPGAIKVAHPDAYESLLKDHFVIADFNQRRSLIQEQINKAAQEHGAVPVVPAELLDEVSSIVEWPKTIVAGFDKAFLGLPEEALIASMQLHQKCFALKDKEGQLLPLFVAVTNLESLRPEQVIRGNEKVMRARLSDADFFFCQDKKTALSHLIPSTQNVVFQDKLGSLLDKSKRLQALMQFLAPLLGLGPIEASRAAELSKCDLMTGMVLEFPELQGTMGYYYALHAGESRAVAEALWEQYLPRFSGDSLPKTPLGQALSIAERADTLVGIFALGQRPSGDKDPFKLRRHALALARLLIACPQLTDFSQLIQKACDAYGTILPKDAQGHLPSLQLFVLERLQAYYQQQEIGPDIFQAAKALQADDIADLDKRVRALAGFVHSPAIGSLSQACKRVNNLLRAENSPTTSPLDPGLLQEPAETSLWEALTATAKAIGPLYEQQEYTAILAELAGLKGPVDAFFNEVMVMVEDEALKQNRLSLLAQLKAILQGVADMSLLQPASP